MTTLPTIYILQDIARFACIPLIWFTLNLKGIGNIFVVRLAGEEVFIDRTGLG
jgi:hypothetical protein